MEITINTEVNIGDKLYYLSGSEIKTCIVTDILINFNVKYYDIENDDKGISIKLDKNIPSQGGNKVPLNSIGDLVFKSKADIIKKFAEQL